MNKWSDIEKQVLWTAMAPVLLLAFLLDGFFIYFGFNDLDEMFRDRNKLIAQQLVLSAEYGIFSDNRVFLQQQVRAVLANAEVKAAAIHNREHQLLALAGNAPEKVNQHLPFFENHDSVWIYQTIYPTEVQINETIDEDLPPKVALGSVTIEVSKLTKNRDKFEFLIINFGLVFLVLLTALLIASRFSRRITEPILSMRHALKKVGEGQLNEPIILQTTISEFKELAIGLNEMTEQLLQERAYLEQRITAATQELRLRKTQAEEANANKTKFLAAASHDLRQPMHALGLFVGEIQELMVSAEQKQVAERIETSVHAMSDLLDSLLDLSKLDAGVVMPHLEAVDLNSFLRRLTDDYSTIAAEKCIQFRMLPTAYAVYSDPQLLERILGNLLGNAVRYTQPKGAILIACRRRGDRIRIEVRDSGIGIELAHHQAIFREFVHLTNMERDRSKGLGLGLSIVQRLVKLLGHHLEMKSALNLGSTFSIELNRFDSQTAPVSGEIEPGVINRKTSSMVGQKILVVDDDALVRESTKGILESWGCQVTVAETVTDAIQLCSTSTFELIICDFRLPDGSGLQVAEYLKSHFNLPPQFILISGDTAPDILSAIDKLGFDVLNKPVRPAKLRSLILHLLNKKVSS